MRPEVFGMWLFLSLADVPFVFMPGRLAENGAGTLRSRLDLFAGKYKKRAIFHVCIGAKKLQSLY